MKYWRTILAVTTLAMALAASQAEATVIFRAMLTGDQEVIPTGSSATGFAELVLNDAMDRLEMNISLSGVDLDGNQTPGDMTDDVIGFHIHRAPVGVNGPVVFGFISPNSDLNADLMIDPVAGTVFSAWDLAEGNGTTLAAELPNLFDEGLYFNVHTPDFPGGEIRGQILLPAPGTLALLGAGLWLLGRRRRRRKLKAPL